MRGTATAGRLLSATSVKVDNGIRLSLPTGAYHTWKGAILEEPLLNRTWPWTLNGELAGAIGIFSSNPRSGHLEEYRQQEPVKPGSRHYKRT
jgi:hypothetical protein